MQIEQTGDGDSEVLEPGAKRARSTDAEKENTEPKNAAHDGTPIPAIGATPGDVGDPPSSEASPSHTAELINGMIGHRADIGNPNMQDGNGFFYVHTFHNVE
jgi:hypothetical protein